MRMLVLFGFEVLVLAHLPCREMEARDAAKVSLRCPCWTISSNAGDLEKVVKIAG